MTAGVLDAALIQIEDESEVVIEEILPFTVSFYALGCRLNQSEAGSLAGGFAVAGFQVNETTDPSDIAVINTCSVTHQAEVKCRGLIRRILRQNPRTFIAVTGCYAQIGIASLKNMGGVDLIAGTDHKMSLPSLVRQVIQEKAEKRTVPFIFHSPQINRDDFTVPDFAVFDHHTRPNIKIQDGCDFFCSFCIIPTTRGRSRSRAFDDVLLEAQIWADRGHREIVLTGVNLGEYSSDGKDLVALIQALEQIERLHRIRISSIEPTTISDALIDWMAQSEKLCPYLHLPLQSGSDRVLTDMGRRYSVEDYKNFVAAAIQKVPNLSLGTDVMVGFPGEDEAAFQETVSVIESLPFSYLHVFPYSRRKGTRVMRSNLLSVHPTVIKARSKMLCVRSKEKRRAFYEKQIGREVDVLFETRNKEGLFCGLTANYLRVGIASKQDLSGCLKSVQVDSITENLALGHLLT